MTAPDPSRMAYEARFTDERPRHFDPWDSMETEAKVIWARVERASQAHEHSGFSGAGIHMVCGSRSDIDLVQRWCHEASTIPALRERIRSTEHFNSLRTRQKTQASEAWARAAERALTGSLRALHDRLRLHRDVSYPSGSLPPSTRLVRNTSYCSGTYQGKPTRRGRSIGFSLKGYAVHPSIAGTTPWFEEVGKRHRHPVHSGTRAAPELMSQRQQERGRQCQSP